MLETGIISAAAYLPRLRLSRAAIADANKWANPALSTLAKGHRAVCSHDEDSLTMGVEAARLCLSGTQTFQPERLEFASTTAPFIDRASSIILSEALTLPASSTMCRDITGSLACGTAGLINALKGQESALLVAADKRPAKVASAQELTFGHAAAAIAVGSENPIARIVASTLMAVDFPDHYRKPDAKTDYYLEERWVRDEGIMKIVPLAVTSLLREAGYGIEDIAHIAFAGMNAGGVRQIAKTLSIGNEQLVRSLDSRCGETGTAHGLLMLCQALETARPGEKILLVHFAQGCQAVLVEATEAIADWDPKYPLQEQLASGVEDENYLRFLSFSEHLQVDWGVRAERDARTSISAFYRNRRALTAFVGGVCTACGTQQFPKGQGCVNPDCRQLGTLVDEPFQHKSGRIKSFTEDWLAISENPPFKYGNVVFEGGGVVMMEFADFDEGQLEVGLPVRPVFRIKEKDPKRNFHRYNWKAAPLMEGKGA